MRSLKLHDNGFLGLYTFSPGLVTLTDFPSSKEIKKKIVTFLFLQCRWTAFAFLVVFLLFQT